MKDAAKELKKFLKQQEKKPVTTKKAYEMADSMGRGYEAIEMQKFLKAKKK